MWPPFWLPVSLFPHHSFRKCFPSLKGEGLTAATCVSAADRWSAQATEGGASPGEAAVTGGMPLGNIFFSIPQPHPLVTPQEALLVRVAGEKCTDHAKHHPCSLPFASLSWVREGGPLPYGQTPISQSKLSSLAFLRAIT